MGRKDVEGYVTVDSERPEDRDYARREERDPHARSTSPLRSVRGSSVWFVQCALYSIVILIALWSYKHYEHEGDIRYRPALREALADRERRPGGYGCGEKVFIAAAFHQNEAVIPYWTRTMLDTIVWLGADNVFVSIVENYSSDRRRATVVLTSHARRSSGSPTSGRRAA